MSLKQHGLVGGITLVLMTIISIATFSNLQSTGLHALGILVIIVLDVIVAWSLYYVLKPASADISLLASLMRIVYSAAFFAALALLQNLEAFNAAWNMSLFLFGIHLLLAGYLVMKANYMPTWLGALVALAGLGYVIDSTSLLIDYPVTVSMFTFFGELILAIWLIAKRNQLPEVN